MSAHARRLCLAAALALLSSCSPPPIEISVEKVDGRLHLTLLQDWGFVFPDRKAPCVREIGLHEPETYDRDHAAWLIEAEGDVQCLGLASLVLGEAPKGWRQVAPLSAVRGRTYTVRAQGIGWGETRIRF